MSKLDTITAQDTADFMVAVGGTPIDGVLGTYQANVDERNRVLDEILQQAVPSPELTQAYGAVERRLWLYRLLAHEVGR